MEWSLVDCDGEITVRFQEGIVQLRSGIGSDTRTFQKIHVGFDVLTEPFLIGVWTVAVEKFLDEHPIPRRSLLGQQHVVALGDDL